MCSDPPKSTSIAGSEANSAVPAVQAIEVGKRFWLDRAAPHRLREVLLGPSKSALSDAQLWALKDVSFEVHPGEVFGVLGTNGAGKTTLLQILGGILQPTQGRVEIPGTVAALLEIGAGFDPNYTGRQNVFMNASLIGVERSLVEERFDEIVEFAEIGDFLDRPVKTYSSGMFLRLAFAVSTCLAPDVLLIDETLAVGDVFFRQKCYRRLEELRCQGTAIVLVSHSPGEVEQLCSRALLLDQGKPLFVGSASAAVKRYYLVGQGSLQSSQRIQSAPPLVRVRLPDRVSWPQGASNLLTGGEDAPTGSARCLRFSICDANGETRLSFEQGETASFLAEFELQSAVEVPTAGIELVNQRGVVVHGKSTLEQGSKVPRHLPAGSHLLLRQEVALELEIGEYTVNLGLGALEVDEYEERSRLSYSELDTRLLRLCLIAGVASLAIGWRIDAEPVQLLHHGVANLPGSCQLERVAGYGDRDD